MIKRKWPPHPDDDDAEAQTKWFQLTAEQVSDWRYVVAIDTADDFGDLTPLSDCFRANPPSAEVCILLADLLWGRRLGKGFKPTPEQELILAAVNRCHKRYRKPGETQGQQIRRIIRAGKLSAQQEAALRRTLDGRNHLAEQLRKLRQHPAAT